MVLEPKALFREYDIEGVDDARIADYAIGLCNTCIHMSASAHDHEIQHAALHGERQPKEQNQEGTIRCRGSTYPSAHHQGVCLLTRSPTALSPIARLRPCYFDVDIVCSIRRGVERNSRGVR